MINTTNLSVEACQLQGTITVGLAERVPDGTVVGVDAEPTMVGFGSGHPKSLRTLANFMTSRRGLPFTGVKS
ncbi:MAG: class I SAM-dependent methyltransferase [Actinomycetota bacterium]|nr:class I SAM-dependent methyltransferase [Actinomycetota bacterium]